MRWSDCNIGVFAPVTVTADCHRNRPTSPSLAGNVPKVHAMTFGATKLPASGVSAAMRFDDNFVCVPGIPATIIDPTLKLRLTTGRWNPESASKGGTIEIHLFHDPEIEPDCLTMPPSVEFDRLYAMLGNPPLKEVAFASAHSMNILDTSIDIGKQGEEITLICGAGVGEGDDIDMSFRYAVRLIEMSDRDVVSEYPWATLLYALTSIPKLPLWESEYAARWKSKCVNLYAPHKLALELEQNAGFSMPPGGGKFIKISGRQFVA